MIGEAEEEGDWNQCFFGSVRSKDVEDACHRFWSKKEIDFIDRDDYGKIIDIIRTDVDRVRPTCLYLNFETPKKHT